MKRYEIFPHTADIGIRAFGKTVKELFENASLALFSLMFEKGGEDREKRSFDISSSSLDLLLVKYLTEFLYLFDVEFFVPSRVEIDYIDEKSVRGKVYGEKFDERKHEVKYNIKAITLHNLHIEKEKNIYKVEIILDI